MTSAKVRFQVIPAFAARFLIVFFLLLAAFRSQAFSLIGPFTDWMCATNGYQMGSDIGGPMNINEEYRWNVPIVTYGFDKSFLDYFGSNGVAAVESAIQVFNDLPPASSIVLSNYPFSTLQVNSQAQSNGIYDLKSMTLALLLEQLGLTQPTRNIFDIRQWTPELLPPYSPRDCDESCFDWAIPNFIIERNFDPETLAPSHSVDDVLYSGFIQYWTNLNLITSVVPFPADPTAHAYTAVGDALNAWSPSLQTGYFYTGLTRDDVGGIRYLLNQTNVNYENLLPRVHSQGSARRPVDGALRPGVEKITFLPHLARRDGKFGTTTLRFTDTCVTNEIAVQQKVRRIVHQPDFLFSASNFVGNWPLLFQRTGTTNWVNNAALNGAATNAGPGVIRPPVKITFMELAPSVETDDSGTYVSPLNWGSFDGSTNPAVIYPISTKRVTTQCTVHLTVGSTLVTITNQIWQLKSPSGTPIALQMKTNGMDWTTVATVTNNGGVVLWHYEGNWSPLPLFNAVPAP